MTSHDIKRLCADIYLAVTLCFSAVLFLCVFLLNDVTYVAIYIESFFKSQTGIFVGMKRCFSKLKLCSLSL